MIRGVVMFLAGDNWSAININGESSVIRRQSYCFLSDKTTFFVSYSDKYSSDIISP